MAEVATPETEEEYQALKTAIEEFEAGRATGFTATFGTLFLSAAKRACFAYEIHKGLTESGRAVLRNSKGEPMMVVEENTFDIE